VAVKREMDSGEETVRLLATLVRLQTGSQTEAVLELHKSGLGTSRIAELLGTTAGTVNVAIQRSKKPAKAKKEKR
jgi:DNA-directed RNA polymerase specialized sigma24 family protein